MCQPVSARILFFVCVCVCERERDRQTDRQTDRDRDRERQTQRERQKQTETETDSDQNYCLVGTTTQNKHGCMQLLRATFVAMWNTRKQLKPGTLHYTTLHYSTVSAQTDNKFVAAI